MAKEEQKTDKQKVYTSILLLISALVCVSVATVAWFTIADRTKVNTMDIDVTTGTNLRFDLDPHDSFDEYIKTLKFSQIQSRIKEDMGVDISQTFLTPVTTKDCITFTYGNEKAAKASTGAYLEFTLNFMSTADMYVHLTTVDGEGNDLGTKITSKNDELPPAMRISFSAGDSVSIYDPGLKSGSTTKDGVKTFGLSENMVYSDDNTLFFAPEGVNVPVVVHVWIEGNDELCTDKLRGADYSIRLRFVGTDSDNQLLDKG